MCYKYGFSSKTSELAIIILKQFSYNCSPKDYDYQLNTLVSLSIASKLEEDIVFSIKHVLLE